jgi:hypothetical protein
MEKIVFRQCSDGFCVTEGGIHQVNHLFLIDKIILREVVVFVKEKYLQTSECTYSMEQNSSWEFIRFSASQEIVSFLSLASVQNIEKRLPFYRVAQDLVWIVSSGVC